MNLTEMTDCCGSTKEIISGPKYYLYSNNIVNWVNNHRETQAACRSFIWYHVIIAQYSCWAAIIKMSDISYN